MATFTEEERESIRKHRYVHVGVPLLETYRMSYWIFLEKIFPARLGFCIITLLGLGISIVTCIAVWYFSPDAKQTVPAWALWVAAVGVHLYQACDGIDGVHERKTGGNEVLGEYFDHACDAFTTAFLSTRLCIAVGIGTHPLLAIGMGLSAHVAFYLTHWNAYTTGLLEFELVDNGEGQDMIIFACVLAAVFGTNVYDLKDPMFGIDLKVYVALLTMSGVASHTIKKLLVLRKRTTTVTGSSAPAALLPLMFALVLAFAIFMRSTSGAFEENLSLYICMFGTLAAKLIHNIMLAKIARKKLRMIDAIYFGPLALLVNQLLGCPINEYFVLVAAFVYCAWDHCSSAYGFGRDICEIHDAPFFTVPEVNTRKEHQT